MSKLTAALLVVTLVGLFSIPPGQGDEPKINKDDSSKLHLLMERKLDNAQKLLAAIAKNDQKSIIKHADELVAITREAQWKVFKTREYETYSDDFRHSAEQLVTNAKDKNLDAAQLTYLQLTLACFNCHKYVRDQH